MKGEQKSINCIFVNIQSFLNLPAQSSYFVPTSQCLGLDIFIITIEMNGRGSSLNKKFGTRFLIRNLAPGLVVTVPYFDTSYDHFVVLKIPL